ncbi:MAG TPA: glycosyltransferase family 4 protein [Desulfobacterales bacterium]|nr:glycosyltransferase family 4 protein [Desulfobacterales bacterium]
MNKKFAINLVLGHAVPFPPTRGGGIETLYNLLTNQWAQDGHQITVYSRKKDAGDNSYVDDLNIWHIKVDGFDWTNSRFLNICNSARWLKKVMSKLETGDVTLFNTFFSFMVTNKKCGIRITTLHRTPKKTLKYYWKKHDRIYAGSRAVIEQAEDICGPMPNAKYIYNCINTSEVNPEIKDYSKIKGLEFLYVGRFVWDKGLEFLIKGFEISLKQFPANKLIFLGPKTNEQGAEEVFFNRMKEYINDKKLNDKIIFADPVFDKKKLYENISKADIFTVPTITGETFSMAILEGMALAKPVLTSDFPPMIEAVDHKVNGYISKVKDAESLAEGIAFFSNNINNMQKYQKAALEKVKNFTVEKIAQEYIKDFRHLINS